MSFREALEANDLEKLKTLVQALGKNELKSALLGQNIVPNSNEITIDVQGGSESLFNKILRSNPEFAYKILFLFSPTDRKEIYPDFAWKDVFTFVQQKNNLTADNKFKSHLTAKQFAEKIRRIFPEIKSEELDCNSFTNLKHYRAALTLGMPYTHDFFIGSLKTKVFSSNNINDLLQWLIRHKYMTRSPFTVSDLAHQLIHGNKYITRTILKEFPNCIEEIDDKGNNVLYYCAKSLERFRSVLRLLEIIRNTLSSQKLVEMLAHKCQDDRSPVLLLSRHATKQFQSVPVEFIRAYGAILHSNNTKDIATMAQYILDYGKDKALELLLHLQLGISPRELPEFKGILPPMQRDAKTGLFFFEFPKTEIDKKKQAVEDEGDNESLLGGLLKTVVDLSRQLFTSHKPDPDVGLDADQPAYILDLPDELLLLVSLYLPPVDAFDYLTSCKRLAKCLQSDRHEHYWRDYCQRHFFPRKLTGSWKKQFLGETRGVVNWRTNKCRKLTVPELGPTSQPLLMDENWLYLSENYSAPRLWNCHSQRIEFRGTSPAHLQPAAMLSSYNHNEIPPVIVYEGWQPRNYKVMRGETVAELPNLTDVYKTRPFSYRGFSVMPIDHRVVLSEKSMLYDVEQDRVLNQLAEEPPTESAHAYNPFNKTILRTTPDGVEIYSLDYKLLQSIDHPTWYSPPVKVLQMIDEYTFLFVVQGNLFTSSIYDIRNGKSVLSVDNMFRFHDAVVQSPHRLVFRSARAPLMASWNLRTRQIEWVECTEQYPKCINSRYLVSVFAGQVEIRDYCTN